MDSISIAVQAKIPSVIWGPPGVGKTSYCNALGRSLDTHFETVIASIREPSDFGGLPHIDKKSEVLLAPPQWAKRLYDIGHAHPDNPLAGILFIDEITTAPPATQAALLRVVFERVVGDLTLPDNIGIITAANPPEMAAGGWDLEPPLANRFLHLTWELDTQAWADGLVSDFPDPNVQRLPEDWTEQIPVQRATVAAFAKARSELVFELPKNKDEQGRAWPTPRAWTNLATLLAAAESISAGDDTRYQLAGGMVGLGAATEFISFLDELDLPDPEELLKNSDKFKLPKRSDKQYAVLSAVIGVVVNKPDIERWDGAWEILSKASEQGAADIAAASSKHLINLKTSDQHGLDLPVPVKHLEPFAEILAEAGFLERP